MALLARPLGARQGDGPVAHLDDPVAFGEVGHRGTADQLVDDAQRGDDGRRVDVSTPALVVEADVAAHHRQVEGAARVGDAVDRLRELPHHLGVLRVAEVEAVDEGDGAGADGGQVQHGLHDGRRSSAPGIDRAPAVVAVRAEREAAARVLARLRVLQPEHRGVGARSDDGVEVQLVVVLRPHPAGVDEHVEQVGPWVGRGGQAIGPIRAAGVEVGGLGHRPPVLRGVLLEGASRDVAQHLGLGAAIEVLGGMVEDPQPTRSGHPTDDRGGDVPPARQGEHLVEVLRLHDGEHPLLRLRGHHLERLHARLALVDPRDVHVHPCATLGRRLGGGAREASSAQVLDTHGETGVEQLEAGLDQPLLLERVAHLHAGPLLGILLLVAEAGRGQHRHAADPVATGGRTEQHREVPGAGRPPEHEPLVGQHPEAEHVDQRVVLVGLVEDHLAAHGGHAHRVAVAADAGDHALGDPAAAGVVEGAEPQRIHGRDRARPHGEDVTEDATDAGGRTLVRLDGGRVVVALDADRCCDPVTDVDDPGALSGTDQHPRRLRREPTEVDAGGLVAAVLRPHHRVHGQLEVVGIPTEDAPDGFQFVVGQSERLVDGDRLVGGHAAHATCPAKSDCMATSS